MSQRLDRLIRDADPLASILSDDPHRRVDALRDRLAGATDLQARVTATMLLGRELLAVGRTREAIAAYDGLVAAAAGRARPEEEAALRGFLAAAYLRLAEEDNCMTSAGPRACLLPLEGSGIHQAREGAAAAAAELERALELAPGDPGLRWLLNLAHMSLGSHPRGVAEERRIAVEVFGAAPGVPRFPNVATELGLDVLGLAGGAVMEDLNGDGLLDLVASGWGLREPLRLFVQRGDGGFDETGARAGLSGLTGGLNLVHADYDDDGDADLLVLRGAWLGEHGRYPNSLLRNRGDATFEDVTEAAGMLSFHPTQTAAWSDFDGDGDLDLFVGNESSGRSRSPCELYRNDGDGTFSEVAAAVGLAHVGFVKAAAWGDYDNDGRPDLYLSRMGQPNVLLRNEGPRAGEWSFADVTETAGVAEPIDSFPAWFWDYDNDGWQDLLVLAFPGFNSSSLGQVIGTYLGLPAPELDRTRLYRNRGDGTFEDVSAAAGLDVGMLAMGAGFGDLDNDGWLDFYVGTGEPDLATLVPNRMYRNTGRGAFDNVTITGGFGHLQKGHGVAWGDVDNDGDQDIYQVMGGAFPADTARNTLYLNPGTPHRWLGLLLEGVTANRSAIGARVKIVLRTPDGARDLHATVGPSGSFGSSSLRLEVGLGDADGVERVEIDWPGSAVHQTTGPLEVDRFYLIREGNDPAPLVLPRVALAAEPAG